MVTMDSGPAGLVGTPSEVHRPGLTVRDTSPPPERPGACGVGGFREAVWSHSLIGHVARRVFRRRERRLVDVCGADLVGATERAAQCIRWEDRVSALAQRQP